MLTDMTIYDFSDVLASGTPAPGGGSAAAVSGALGASLGLMVINLTVKKKAFLALDAQIQARFNETKAPLEALKNALLQLTDDDAAAFNEFMAAVKLTAPERETALSAASERIIDVPLATMRACGETLKHLETVAKHGNKNAVSDAGAGAAMAYAGLCAAHHNVKINLSGAPETKRGGIIAEAGGLAQAGEISYGLIKKIVEGALS